VTPYLNGPYLVRGAAALIDADGNQVELRRHAVAICRCGRSRSAPFCDGTHKVVGFSAPGRGQPDTG